MAFFAAFAAVDLAAMWSHNLCHIFALIFPPFWPYTLCPHQFPFVHHILFLPYYYLDLDDLPQNLLNSELANIFVIQQQLALVGGCQQ